MPKRATHGELADALIGTKPVGENLTGEILSCLFDEVMLVAGDWPVLLHWLGVLSTILSTTYSTLRDLSNVRAGAYKITAFGIPSADQAIFVALRLQKQPTNTLTNYSFG